MVTVTGILFCLAIVHVFADDCGGEKFKDLGNGVIMRCRKGIWRVSKRSQPKGPPCSDDPSLAANGTCSADRGHCQQYTVAGADMDRDCPETCESCDACRCQDASQWHSYCGYWSQYCGSSGVLGTWMTSNCRKTCGKCSCKCCSYQGKQHQLGARIQLPEKCGELVCEEGLVADYSPLLKGAAGHKVSHPEELTLNFRSVHTGADCCILPGDARSADGSSFPNGTMVQEGSRVARGSVRLSSHPKGRIEIFNGTAWGTLCGHYWWDNEKGAENLCKQMGYESGVKYTAPGGTGPIVAGNRLCAGGEPTVYDCPLKRKPESLECTHANDQGVHCAGKQSKKIIFL